MTETQRPTDTPHGDPRPTRALIVSALVGPVIASAGLVALLAARDDLPARIAVHWDVTGAPDRFLGFTGTAVTAGLVTALVPLALVAVGAFMHRSARGSAAALAGGLAVLLGGVTFGSALAQRGRGSTTPGFPGWWWLGAAVVGALIVGTALARWGRSHEAVHPGPRGPMPEEAARLEVSPTTRLAWVGRTALPSRMVLTVSVLGLLAVVWVALSGFAWVLVIVPALGTLVLGTYAARVVIDRSGLRVTSLGLTWLKVALDHIDHASVGTVSPMREFGGWGSRVAIDGRRGYVTRAGEALVVRRVGQSDVVVTIDGSEEAAAVLNTLALRAG